MSIIEAKEAEQTRILAASIVTEIKTIMSNPVEYIEKGYWTLTYSEDMINQLNSSDNTIREQATRWVNLYLSNYGWVHDEADTIRPIGNQVFSGS